MVTYFKMKIKEHKIKLLLYSAIEEIINEKKDITTTIKNLYFAMKNVPIDELQDEFISKLAEIIHNETHLQASQDNVIEK